MSENVTPPIAPHRLARWRALDCAGLPSPCHVIDMGALEENCRLLGDIQTRTGAKILLALKGFATAAAFPLIAKYLRGTTASGLHEALLGHEYFGGESHVYCPAYKPAEVDALVKFADHLVFNTPAQWKRFRPLVEGAGRAISCGLRVNPQYAEVETACYNPCGDASRLGTVAAEITPSDWEGLEGLHFHALCEQGADTLERVLAHLEEKFGDILPRLKWVNFGGGHHITRKGYDVELLCRLIENFKARYGVEVYVEPGEAVVLGTGFLSGTVLDLPMNQTPLAILDVSAACHMPDTLEMPYRPHILESTDTGNFVYRLGGPSCLAGDQMGDYAFENPLTVGQRLTFLDMAHYTMVKATTFNGVPLPAVALYWPQSGKFEVVKTFGYAEYKARLA